MVVAVGDNPLALDLHRNTFVLQRLSSPRWLRSASAELYLFSLPRLADG